jgi:sulfate transport system permease protein
MSSGEAGRRRVLIGVAAVGAALVLGLPLAVLFVEAFRWGWIAYVGNLVQPDTLHAIGLTALAAVVVVPINIGFGIAAAWLVTRFRFPGRKLLVTIIDLPFSISPIVAGVSYLFVYGARGLFGPMLQSAGIAIMFTVWAIFLVSLFVTAPFVARELIPLMETQGSEEEEAAIGLGASGLQTFVKVTLPRIKWALLYGAILCNARVMGEFGAVSVVSGNIRGVTNTLPLQVELLYNDYNAAGAFAAASVLALLAIVTLVLKVVVERRDPMLQIQRGRARPR